MRNFRKHDQSCCGSVSESVYTRVGLTCVIRLFQFKPESILADKLVVACHCCCCQNALWEAVKVFFILSQLVNHQFKYFLIVLQAKYI